ncbi:MAG TPA: gamma-glutamyltransferase [Gemmatimonadota bacterium]|nr:gamma-glutamyltransferase [Gemmatimonadota bacterium]
MASRPFIVLLSVFLFTGPAIRPAAAQQARWWSPVVAENAMVVSAKEEATRVGLDVLQRGGNAADAAIAVHFALAVTLPYAGNIGGGGFLVIREADGRVHTYDYRERAPLAATEDMYLDESGEVIENLSWFGARAVATPGSVAGMGLIHERHATLPWAELLRPAIELAREGYLVDPFTHDVLAGKADDIARFPGAAAILLPAGRVPAIGDTLRQPALARTLSLIAEQGPEVFYEGEIADSIVGMMERRGGLITHEDLARYEAKERPPITFDYRGYRVHSMGPPSSGGLTMQWILDQLETFDLGEHAYHGAASVHRIVEAMRRAFAERNALLGDPDFVALPDSIFGEVYGLKLAASIDTLRATPSEAIRPDLSQAAPVTMSESTETTHFSIIDAEGVAVASTTTINGFFGSLETAAGIFLNNEMDDLTVKPGVPNAYGLVQGEANAIEPGKRPLSAMTPTIVEMDGRVRYVVGSPGGSTIITTVAQILVDAIDYGMTFAEALDARRIHHQHLPDRIYVEPFGLSEDTIERLESMGHEVGFRNGYSGRAEGIEVGATTGLLYGRSDLRGGGLAAGF